MKTRILTVVVALAAVCIQSNDNAKNEAKGNNLAGIEQTNCYLKKLSVLKAGITPPIIPNPRPKKMYEESVFDAVQV